MALFFRYVSSRDPFEGRGAKDKFPKNVSHWKRALVLIFIIYRIWGKAWTNTRGSMSTRRKNEIHRGDKDFLSQKYRYQKKVHLSIENFLLIRRHCSTIKLPLACLISLSLSVHILVIYLLSMTPKN